MMGKCRENKAKVAKPKQKPFMKLDFENQILKPLCMPGGVNISRDSPMMLDTETLKQRSKSPKKPYPNLRFFVTPLGVITPQYRASL